MEWLCPECRFHLTRATFILLTYAFGVNALKVIEECPNGCGPLGMLEANRPDPKDVN